MFKKLTLLAFASSLFAAFACGGDQPDGTESVSAVVPNEVFLGRTETVLIVGNGTDWLSGQISADFGQGVTVDSIEVASASALLATITIEPSAAPGPRDVAVGDGNQNLILKGAFHLDAPIAVEVEGDLAQGSIATVTVSNNDVLSPFDATQEGDGLFTPISFPNINIVLPEGSTAQVNTVSAFSVEFLVLIDVNATAGPTDLQVLSGPAGAEQSFPLPGGLDISERTPETLSDKGESFSFDTPFGTKLFSYSPAGMALLDFAASADNADASPAFALLPASGSWADMISFSDFVSDAGNGDYYLVYWDGSGVAGYTADLLVNEVAAAAMSESEPNDDAANAQVSPSMPVVLQGASLADLDDVDYIELTVSAADVGKSVRVFTTGSDRQSDPVVDVLDSSETSLGGPSDDADFHEDFTSTPIDSAGIYYVRVTASDAGFFSLEHTSYDVAIQLVD